MKSTLILVAGFSASGKNLVGKRLARELGACYLDKDTLSGRFIDPLLVALGEREGDRDSEAYQRQARPLEYGALMDVCYEVAELGANVVAAAPFQTQLIDEEWMDELDRQVAERGLCLVICWVHCDRETLRQRMTARGSPRDLAKLEDWESYDAIIDEQFPSRVSRLLYVIDNSGASTPELFERQFEDLVAFVYNKFERSEE
jgi:predicted kinase